MIEKSVKPHNTMNITIFLRKNYTLIKKLKNK